MKLLPKNVKVPALGATETIDDPMVLVKLFHPFSSWTWYILEYCPEDNLCFGLTDGHEVELGYFSLEELEKLRFRGLPVERDMYWNPVKLSVLKERLKKNRF